MTPLLACLVFQTKTTAPKPLPPALKIARERERYRFDMKRVFYATPAAKEADYKKIEALWAEIWQFRGQVAASPENLLKVLTLSEQMQALQARIQMSESVAAFLDIRRDSRESASRSDGQGDGTEVAENFVTEEVAAVDAESFEAMIAKVPALAPYRFHVETQRRAKSHRLPGREEGILQRFHPYYGEWQTSIFEHLRREKPSAGIKEALGVVFMRLAGSKIAEAKLRGFKDAREEFLFSIHLQPSQADQLMKKLVAQLPSLRTFQWAMGAIEYLIPEPPPFSLASATALVRAAMSPLGAEYGRELAAVLNPANGRIDVAGGPHRAQIGTGWGFPATQPSILYWPKYTGVYDDLDRGLSHEGGHAVHFQLMRANRVLPSYSQGPGYFFESFAEFNSMLLADYMTRRETVPKRKLFYLLQFLNKFAMPVQLAFFPALEFAIYDGIGNGTVRTAADLDRVERKITQQYVGLGTRVDPLSPYWATNEVYFEDPFYNFHHVLGSALAVAYYDLYKRDPKSFVPKYLALMRNGFDAPPEELLKRFLNLDINDPKLITGTGEMLNKRLPELRSLTLKALSKPTKAK